MNKQDFKGKQYGKRKGKNNESTAESSNPKPRKNVRKEKVQNQAPVQNYQNRIKRNPQMPRITEDMKKIRDVSPRFLENKKRLVSKYREYGIEDGDVWTSSTGEGLSYQNLLKMPFYEDCHKLPENVVIKKGKYIVNEKLLNWDDYFTALQKNFQVGITSKAKVSKQIKEKNLKQSQSNAADDLYEGKIEWDDIQQPSETDKDSSVLKQKYKMQLKQITENERREILKEIEKDELSHNQDIFTFSQSSTDKSQNMANFLKSAVIIPEESSEIKEFKIFSVEEIENKLVSIDSTQNPQATENRNQIEPFEDFYDDENGGGENQLAISKENKDSNNYADDEPVEFDNIDVLDLKASDSTNKSAFISFPIQKDIHEENQDQENEIIEESKEPEEEIKIISAEDLDKIQTKSVFQTKEIELPNSQKQTEEQINYSQNTFISTKQNSEVNSTKYEVNQDEIEQQYLIDQLNQEGIKTAIMKNAKLMNQYQKTQSSKSFMHYIPTPDPETNPFESFLQNGYNNNFSQLSNTNTSQWFYKDPQGCVRGPFSCFDMYTWHSQGYFNEDLELSLDSHHFFTLKELRMLNQGSHQQVNMYQNQYMSQSYPQMMYQPEVNQMYGYTGGGEHQAYYQYQAYPQQQYQYQENYYPQYSQAEYYHQASPNPPYYSTYVQNNYYDNQ